MLAAVRVLVMKAGLKQQVRHRVLGCEVRVTAGQLGWSLASVRGPGIVELPFSIGVAREGVTEYIAHQL